MSPLPVPVKEVMLIPGFSGIRMAGWFDTVLFVDFFFSFCINPELKTLVRKALIYMYLLVTIILNLEFCDICPTAGIIPQ